MNARLTRDQRDDVQVRALRDSSEKRRARQLAHEELLEDVRTSRFLSVVAVLIMLVIYTLSVAFIAAECIAWYVTGDDRFVWIVGGTGAAIVVGYSYLFRKHPDGVGR